MVANSTGCLSHLLEILLRRIEMVVHDIFQEVDARLCLIAWLTKAAVARLRRSSTEQIQLTVLAQWKVAVNLASVSGPYMRKRGVANSTTNFAYVGANYDFRVGQRIFFLFPDEIEVPHKTECES